VKSLRFGIMVCSLWLGVLGLRDVTGAEPPAAAAVNFNIDRQPMGDAINAFAAQTGLQVLLRVEGLPRGLTAPRVAGSLTPQAALTRLLEGSGLEYEYLDDRTVAVRPAKSGARSGEGAPTAGRAQYQDSAFVTGEPQAMQKVASVAGSASEQPPQQQEGESSTDDTAKGELTVTGTRLRGLLGDATAQPVLTIDSAQIDRTGVQTIGELLRYIPQVSAFTTGQANTQNARATSINFVTGTLTSYGVPTSMTHTAGMVTATLRGAPAGATLLLIDGKRVPKNNQSRGGDGFDLNGIPLSAVDRIEVLLDGASSVYGADAMGGVINVILKENYSGTELRLGYENTFDSDVGAMTGSLSHGFGTQKFQGLLTASWEQANDMMLRDRDFLSSFDRRPFGGTDRRTSAGGAGRVSRSGSVPLPGLTTTASAIPSGTSGVGLTVAAFTTAGTVSGPYDAAQYTQYAASYDRHAVLTKFDYSVADSLDLYATARFARNSNFQLAAPVEALNLTIPAGYPGNPFGIPVVLNKTFYDVQPRLEALNDTWAVTIGAAGDLAKGWRYDLSFGHADSHTRLDGEGGTSISSALFNAAIAAGQTPNLFYDSSRVSNPNAPGVIEALTSLTRNEEKNQTRAYTLQFDGPVWSLPAGDIVTALGVERREESADFPLRAATDTTTAQSGSDDVMAYFAEMNVPLFGQTHRRALLHQLNVLASYRSEDYGAGGSSRNPRLGLAWRPASWLLLRGSYGEGSKIPTLQQRTQPILVSNSLTTPIAANFDPLRGNTINPVHPQTRGGNPGLNSEASENTTAGLVADIPFFTGLSLSFDWFDNVYRDRITALTFNQMALLYPERLTRGANLGTDQPGWAGPVIAADLRAINVALSQISGYDINTKYERNFARGFLQASVGMTKYTTNVSIPTPGGAPSPSVNTDSLPVQFSGNVFFYREAWGLGSLVTYRAENRATPTEAFTPSAIRWDLQYNYDFAKSAGAGLRQNWLQPILADTRLSLTIYNVFNARPPFTDVFFPDNTVLDSRMRRYALSLRRSF